MRFDRMGRVLVVDDETNASSGYRRMLHRDQNCLEFAFAKDSSEALDFLGQCDFDVIITDMRMPIMHGPELLARVKEQYPAVVRIALTGHTNMASSLLLASLAHQFLIKPCDATTLRAIINRACALSEIHLNRKLHSLF